MPPAEVQSTDLETLNRKSSLSGSFTSLFDDEEDYQYTDNRNGEDLGVPVAENDDDDENTQRPKPKSRASMLNLDDKPYPENSNAIASSSEDDLDDSSIEAEEEQLIRAELGKQKDSNSNSTHSIPGPVTLRRLSQSQQARQFNGMDSDDSDNENDNETKQNSAKKSDKSKYSLESSSALASSSSSSSPSLSSPAESSSSSSSLGDDFLEGSFDLPSEPNSSSAASSTSNSGAGSTGNNEPGSAVKRRNSSLSGRRGSAAHKLLKPNNRRRSSLSHNQAPEISFEDFGALEDEELGNDDSYLWQYFFSSDDENSPTKANNPINYDSKPKTRRASKAQKHRNNLAHEDSFQLGDNNEEHTGSTDEDIPLLGRGPLPADQIAKKHGYANSSAYDSFMGADDPGADSSALMGGLDGVDASGLDGLQNPYAPSGDSTDEDDGVPPERKRKKARGTKAIEVLGSNSFSARPPVLGSWRIKGDKNVGIIDGLTTRTLSPHTNRSGAGGAGGRGVVNGPLESPVNTTSASPGMESPFEGFDSTINNDIADFTDFGDAEGDITGDFTGDYTLTPTKGGDKGGSHHKHGHHHEHHHDSGDLDEDLLLNNDNLSDLDLLELGNFINTEGMSSDGGEHFEFDLDFDPSSFGGQSDKQGKQGTSPVSPYLYRNRLSSHSQRDNPASAFRHRGSPYVANPAYPVDNVSPAPWKRRGSQSVRRASFKDAASSPGIQKRKGKKLRTGSRSANPEDYLGDLIEINDLPLYESYDS